MRISSRQSGWSLIVVLAALVIVALLARDALVRYFNVVTRADVDAAATGMHAPARSPGTAPAHAIERADGVDELVRRQREELSRRIEGSARE